jgi:hypothetical protein
MTAKRKTAPALDGDRAVSVEASNKGSVSIVAQTCDCGTRMTVHPASQPDSTWTTATCPACPKWRFVFLRRDGWTPRQRASPEPRTTTDQLEWLDSYR